MIKSNNHRDYLPLALGQVVATPGALDAMVRRLPPDQDCWIDPDTGKRSKRPPAWEQLPIESLRWTLLRSWYELILLPTPWSMGGADAFATQSSAITMLTMRSRIECQGTDWPQMVPCPHCHDWIVWAEAGFVPGYRICRGCHRHWKAASDRGVWIMRRVNCGRSWPYSEVRS